MSQAKSTQIFVDKASNKNKQSESKNNCESNQIAAFVTGGSGYLGRNLIKYLVSKGWKVIAIARSPKSIKAVENAGAVGIFGDLDSVSVMTNAMKQHNCTICFHCAGLIKFWAIYEDALHINKQGTINVIQACQNAGILRLIHVSTNSVLVDKDKPMVNATETTQYPKNGTYGVYGATKKLGEIEALKYNNSLCLSGNNGENRLKVIVVRPPFIWGRDDTSFVPAIIDLIKNGSFAWVDGGIYKISIVHVLNVCHAMYLMAIFDKYDIGGNIYHVTDEMDVIFKYFVRDMLKCVINKSGKNGKSSKNSEDKIDMDKIGNFKYSHLYAIASVLECLMCCSLSKGLNDMLDGVCECQCFKCCFNKCQKHWFCELVQPPITTVEVVEGGRITTINADKIRKDLGFEPLLNIEQGLIEMAKLNGKTEEIKEMQWECLKSRD